MNCPICGQSGILWAHAQDVEYLSSDRTYEYRVCECGSLYLVDPPVSELSTIYPSSYYSYSSSARGVAERLKSRMDMRAFARATRHVKGDDLHALDVGGGAGYYSSILKKADTRIKTCTIVDLDPNLVDVLAESDHYFVNSRIEDFHSDKRYEIILALNLIEHVANPFEILQVLSSLLAPGGVLILQTPNFRSLDARIFRHYSWGGLHAPRHWVLFSRPSIEQIATRASLTILEIRYIQGAPFWTVGLLSRFQVLRSAAERDMPMYKSRAYRGFLPAFALLDVIRRALGFKTSQLFLVTTK